VLDGDPAPPPLKGHRPQFSANVRCGQTAGWTKMPLGMEVGLGPGDFVFDGDPASPSAEKRAQPPHPIFAYVYCGQMAGWTKDATWYGGKPRPRRHCVRWGPSSPLKGAQLQCSAHVYCGQKAGWMKTPLGTEVDHGQGLIVLVRDPAPRPAKGAQHCRSFRPMSIVATVAHLGYC